MMRNSLPPVILAKARTQTDLNAMNDAVLAEAVRTSPIISRMLAWVPAFAGMTSFGWVSAALKIVKCPATGEIVTTWEVRASGATEVKR